MAFSASLSGAGLTPWQQAQALLAFNLGIEAMQLLALAAVLPPLLMLGRMRPSLYGAMRGSAALLAGGLALAWIGERLGMVSFEAYASSWGGIEVAWLVPLMLWVIALACYGARTAGVSSGSH
jgi:hypothetical protein